LLSYTAIALKDHVSCSDSSEIQISHTKFIPMLQDPDTLQNIHNDETHPSSAPITSHHHASPPITTNYHPLPPITTSSYPPTSPSPPTPTFSPPLSTTNSLSTSNKTRLPSTLNRPRTSLTTLRHPKNITHLTLINREGWKRQCPLRDIGICVFHHEFGLRML
jgi:hypothetical protein